MNKTFKAILICLVVSLSLSCKKEEDCADIYCTLQFIVYTVEVKDVNNKPVALDRYSVTNLNTGSELTSNQYLTEYEDKDLGEYPLAADGLAEFNEIINLQFKGFIDSVEVVNAQYSITQDCCHIKLLSGNLQLKVE
jgi:hypothetical protein